MTSTSGRHSQVESSALARGCIRSLMHRSTNQVQCRVEENPDQINVVPVNGAGLDAPMAIRREVAFSPQVPDDEDKDDATDNVEGVHSGHGEDDGAIDIFT